MLYVQRDVDGNIVGIYSNFQTGIAEEEIDNSDPEVIAFLNPVTVLDYENAIQNLVDSTARERQFRDGVTLASYTASTKPKWAAEAQAFVAWRDNVWFYAYGELAKVQAGQRPQPTVDQFLGEIAPIAWPLTS
ncbi:hypothetical protein [Agrobacterium tumefaciens]|uniref:hypothetical protein n=1 Tax=Agrobacterium tumefaciens TaxID=358 RepID=UPI000EF20789|nr:hypothetical protein [Agrobacterium tumefaciens]AYM06238.1 hypothetical protein At1D1460_19960 [Agrobacterium tumefaciens]NSZ34716.1 hypothetical protein [Agrobacterium tumefaciens]QLG22648.1 hypothetical protein EML4_10065 [Agrobacterium tumefaciens]UXS86531.1 hypothetical protein FY144_10025 [Agrobacterium tumefaciens]